MVGRPGALEGMGMKREFWQGRRVLLTGHTGFKGSWLALWMQSMGAAVAGFSLDPPTTPSLYELASVGEGMASRIGDLRQPEPVFEALAAHRPEIVFHLAAQSLVRRSYNAPLETWASNVMGTAHVLDAVRRQGGVRALVIVTSDKCYDNHEWIWGYRENDRLGGSDPYSASKACAELVTQSYQRSFFGGVGPATTAVATARAGNVIGGGDWAGDRLIPDAMRAFLAKRSLVVRNSAAIRPWQHVLEPLAGYLCLAEHLVESGHRFTGAWNFGPQAEDARPVSEIADRLAALWGEGASWRLSSPQTAVPHEAGQLRLDCSKAQHHLGWSPRWRLDQALAATVDWYRGYQGGRPVRALCEQQIQIYQACNRAGAVFQPRSDHCEPDQQTKVTSVGPA